ncbi:hypothetical protein [Streptomyces sp. 7-21]|jgi:hypothetical protein|uniref:hypothetical protein n=1 Tax=Streptomyces sp. 7-21 TaxID=2802283 RepID=UPI00191E0689|nr:hypothetical protein [Streptomyces sp. 7-21]MBL1069064.1 hypothetical protein [Streptomyces sp. 7-21]
MDLEAAIALAGAAANSAAGEAGASAWRALVSLARRLTGRAEAEPAAPEPEDRDALVAMIAARAREDDAFAAALREWAETHREELAPSQTTVHNTISGGATVHGPVIQTKEIHGGLHFGS